MVAHALDGFISDPELSEAFARMKVRHHRNLSHGGRFARGGPFALALLTLPIRAAHAIDRP